MPQEITQEIIEMGRRIRERRLLLRRAHYGQFTQKQVAKELGMSREGYSHYEAGRNQLSPDKLNKLAKLFSVPVTYFYGEIEEAAIHLNAKWRLYDGLPESAQRAVDAQIEAFAEMFKRDDASEELHGKTIGGNRAE